MRIKMVKKVLICVVISLLIGFVTMNDSHAADETWEQKAIAEGVWRCYYALTSKNDFVVAGKITLDDVSTYKDVIGSNKSEGDIKAEDFVPLINGKYKINDSGVSCRQLFGGYDGSVQNFPSLLQTTVKKTIMDKMGYKIIPGQTGECFKVAYMSKTVGGEGNDSPEFVSYESNEVCSTDGTTNNVSVTSGVLGQDVRFVKQSKKLLVKGMFESKDFLLSDYSSFTALKQAVADYLINERFTDQQSGMRCGQYTMFPAGTVTYVCIDPLDGGFMNSYSFPESAGTKYSFSGYDDNSSINLEGRKEAVFVAIKNLVGLEKNSYDGLKYNSDEKKKLFIYYLNDYYGVTVVPDWDKNDSLTRDSLASAGYEFIERTENGKTTSYAVLATRNKDKMVNGLDEEGHFSHTKYSYKDIVAEYDGDPSNMSVEELKKAITEREQTDSGGGIDSGVGAGSRGNCWESGLEAMAWIMCPAENNLKHFANGIWGMIENQLEVSSDLYGNTYTVTDKATGKDKEVETPARIAWGYVRTIANIAMIVFLGIIIFSQLTGYGIDNYGIKKLLPKFIVMAILINLSFIICQLVIDLSNIIGNGIQGLFYGIGNNVINAAGGIDDALLAKEGFIGLITKAIYAIGTVGSGVAVTVITAYTTASSGGGVVLAVILVLLMLLVIIAAILMFFVSLGARMVIILLCTILSPLAFVCYTLPNTKSVYKKWYDAFKAALIVYPICGFTIGLSYIIKAIVLTQKVPFWMLVVSTIMPYLVFFMIPALLKAAISATGAIGAALTSMGGAFKSGVGRLSNTATGAVKDSNAYKMATAERTRQRQASFAMRTKARLDKREASLAKNEKELSPTQQRLRAYAEHTLDKQNAEDVAALQSSFAKKYAKDENLDNIGGALTEALQNHKEGDVQSANRIKALSNLMAARGGKSAAGDIAKAIDKAHLAAGSSAYGVLRDNLSENRDLGSMLKEKRGSMFDNIQKLGGGSIAQSINNGSLNDLKDWSTQGAAEVQQATSSFYGPLTEEQQQARDRYREIIKNMLNSSDPTIQTNVLKNTDKLTAWINAANALGVDVPTQYVNTNSNGEIAREGEIRVIQHGQEFMDQQQQYNSARSNGNGSSANNGGSSS